MEVRQTTNNFGCVLKIARVEHREIKIPKFWKKVPKTPNLGKFVQNSRRYGFKLKNHH